MLNNRRKRITAKPSGRRRSRTPHKLGRIDPESLAAQQGVQPLANPQDLYADFWPPDETADQFNQTVRQWRREGKKDYS